MAHNEHTHRGHSERRALRTPRWQGRWDITYRLHFLELRREIRRRARRGHVARDRLHPAIVKSSGDRTQISATPNSAASATSKNEQSKRGGVPGLVLLGEQPEVGLDARTGLLRLPRPLLSSAKHEPRQSAKATPMTIQQAKQRGSPAWLRGPQSAPSAVPNSAPVVSTKTLLRKSGMARTARAHGRPD